MRQWSRLFMSKMWSRMQNHYFNGGGTCNRRAGSALLDWGSNRKTRRQKSSEIYWRSHMKSPRTEGVIWSHWRSQITILIRFVNGFAAVHPASRLSQGGDPWSSWIDMFLVGNGRHSKWLPRRHHWSSWSLVLSAVVQWWYSGRSQPGQLASSPCCEMFRQFSRSTLPCAQVHVSGAWYQIVCIYIKTCIECIYFKMLCHIDSDSFHYMNSCWASLAREEVSVMCQLHFSHRTTKKLMKNCTQRNIEL